MIIYHENQKARNGSLHPYATWCILLMISINGVKMRVGQQIHRLCLITFLVMLFSSCSRNAEIDLFKAAEQGDTEMVKILLEGGVDVNATSVYDTTALCKAATRGHYEIVVALLAKGADVNRKNVFGETPLLYA